MVQDHHSIPVPPHSFPFLQSYFDLVRASRLTLDLAGVMSEKKHDSTSTKKKNEATSTKTSHSSPPWNFSWVVRGEICACSRPDTEANVNFLRNEGVEVLVTLSREMPPHRSAKTKLEWHLIDVEEFEDPSMEQIDEFVGICERAKASNKIVCVHCRMGRGRTGTMLACYLVKFYQQEPSEAICHIRRMRPHSVETREQERAVKNYRDYMDWGHL